MNNRRKMVIALGVGALAAPFGSFAQQQGKVWRTGFLQSEFLAKSGDRADGRSDSIVALRKPATLAFERGEGCAKESTT